jgi:hypothetical protein
MTTSAALASATARLICAVLFVMLQPGEIVSLVLTPSLARIPAASDTASSGRPREALEAIDQWMQRQECLQVKRQFADRIVWEARRDFVGAVRRAFNVGGRGYALARAHEVAATAVAVDASRTLVRIDADLAPFRSGLARQSGGATVLGVAAGGAMVALHFALAAAIAPALLVSAGAVYVARGINARTATAAQLALEQLLDRLERGEVTKGQPSLLSALAALAASLPRKY